VRCNWGQSRWRRAAVVVAEKGPSYALRSESRPTRATRLWHLAHHQRSSVNPHHRQCHSIHTTGEVAPSSPQTMSLHPHHRRCHSIHTTGEVAPSSQPTMSLHPHHRRGYSIRLSGYVTPSTPPARSPHPHHRRYHSILTTDEVIRLCHSIHTTGEVTRVYSTLTSGDVTQSSPLAMLIPPSDHPHHR
jgi:hypothetical protein